MRSRTTCIAAVLVGQVLGILALAGPSRSSAGASTAAQARAVVSEFFQTINERRFDRTCDLLSARFYEQNHVPDKKHCVFGLTVSFSMSSEVDWRILSIHGKNDRVVVKALADGAPGEVVLIREAGRLKVLSVSS
jgi:hypothetical protein